MARPKLPPRKSPLLPPHGPKPPHGMIGVGDLLDQIIAEAFARHEDIEPSLDDIIAADKAAMLNFDEKEAEAALKNLKKQLADSFDNALADKGVGRPRANVPGTRRSALSSGQRHPSGDPLFRRQPGQTLFLNAPEEFLEDRPRNLAAGLRKKGGRAPHFRGGMGGILGVLLALGLPALLQSME